MKLLIGVIASEEPLYQRLIEEGLKRTWAMAEDDVEIVYYYGGRSSTTVEGDKVFFPVLEGVENIGRKTIEFFRFARERKIFDWLIRTNCSSYIDIANLKRFLLNKPREIFFSAVVNHYAGRPFASGSGYILSSDLVRKVIDNEQSWNHRLLDDVAISFLLQDLGIQLQPGSRQDFQSVDQVALIDTDQYHFRCKSFGPNGHRIDCEIMKRIHQAMVDR